MSFWLTPVGLILPIVIYVLPVIIYRFFIKKEDIEHKKAKWFSIIYCIACFVLIGIISSEDAFFQAFAFVPIGFFNYFLLAGKKMSKWAKWYIKKEKTFAMISSVIGVFFCAVLWLVDVKNTAHLLLRLTLPFALLLFFLFKYRQIEDDVEASRKWQEKLERERLEREQKEKDGR